MNTQEQIWNEISEEIWNELVLEDVERLISTGKV